MTCRCPTIVIDQASIPEGPYFYDRGAALSDDAAVIFLPSDAGGGLQTIVEVSTDTWFSNAIPVSGQQFGSGSYLGWPAYISETPTDGWLWWIELAPGGGHFALVDLWIVRRQITLGSSGGGTPELVWSSDDFNSVWGACFGGGYFWLGYELPLPFDPGGLTTGLLRIDPSSLARTFYESGGENIGGHLLVPDESLAVMDGGVFALAYDAASTRSLTRLDIAAGSYLPPFGTAVDLSEPIPLRDGYVRTNGLGSPETPRLYDSTLTEHVDSCAAEFTEPDELRANGFVAWTPDLATVLYRSPNSGGEIWSISCIEVPAPCATPIHGPIECWIPFA